jgi:hypothetical protein
MKSIKLLVFSAILLWVTGIPVSAHHSITYFDMETQVMHENVTVVSFDVRNPHGALFYTFVNDDGDEEQWKAELPSANFVRRAGIDPSTLSPGDIVTLEGWLGIPERTRGNLIRVSRAEFPNGDVATFTAVSATLTPATSEDSN